MFAIICLNIMLLISCWYLIAENQKNKNKINDLQDDLNKAIKRLAALEEGVTQKSWFRRNDMYPFYWTSQWKGYFLCVIVMNLK